MGKIIFEFDSIEEQDDARMALIYASQSHIIQRVGLIEEEGREPYMGKCYFNKLLN